MAGEDVESITQIVSELRDAPSSMDRDVILDGLSDAQLRLVLTILSEGNVKPSRWQRKRLLASVNKALMVCAILSSPFLLCFPPNFYSLFLSIKHRRLKRKYGLTPGFLLINRTSRLPPKGSFSVCCVYASMCLLLLPLLYPYHP